MTDCFRRLFKPLFYLLVCGTLACPEASARKIVIEASRIEPSRSTTIITSEEIKDSGATTVADLLRDIPGVEVARQGPVGQNTNAFIRGARSESTLVLIDGAEVNDIMSPGAGYDFSTLSADNVDRIEVYRGPQSIRFGAGALGGVINIVTREGNPGLQTHTSVEAGSYNTLKTNLGISGGSDKLRTTLSYENLDSDGFSVAGGSPNGDQDGANIQTFNSKTIWTPHEKSKVTAFVRHSEARLDLDAFGGPFGDDPNFTGINAQWVAGVSGRRTMYQDQWISELGIYFSELDRKTRNLPDPNNPTDYSDHFKGRQRKIKWDNEVILKENHTLLVQIDGRDERGYSTSTFPSLPPSLGEKVETVTGESATYLYEGDRWFGDIGVRADQSTKVSNITSTRLSAGRFIQNRTGKLSVSYGTGFKLPSLYQLYSTYGDENLKAEQSSTYEVSIEKTLSHRFQVVVTYFETKFRELIDFSPHTNSYFNLSRATSKGTESQLLWQLSPDWTSVLWFTYLDAKDDSTGAQLLRRPYHSGGAEVWYKRSKWDGYFRYYFRGERPDLDPVTFNLSSNKTYDLAHFAAGYAVSDNVKLRLKLENIFDKTYQEVLGYSTPRRSIFLSLHYSPTGTEPISAK